MTCALVILLKCVALSLVDPTYRTRAIISRPWLQAALECKPYIRTEFSEKNFLKNKEIVFGNGVKDIQAAAYNGARTVFKEKR